MKLCKTCGEEKPESEFYKAHSTKDNLTVKCKKCIADYYREYRKETFIGRRRKIFTEKQYKVLAIIDVLYKKHGYFPTYNEVGDTLGVSRQQIEQQVKAICKKSLAKCDLKE